MSTILYEIGQSMADAINQAKTDLLTGNNTWTGTNGFVDVTASGTLGVTGNTTLGGTLSVTGDTTFTAGVSVGTDLVVTGNLTVNGTTTSIETTNTTITDNFLVLNKGANDSATEAPDAGILFERASGSDNAAILYEESIDKFEFGFTSADGSGTDVETITLGDISVNEIFLGTRSNNQALGDLADFNAGSSSAAVSGNGVPAPMYGGELLLSNSNATTSWTGSSGITPSRQASGSFRLTFSTAYASAGAYSVIITIQDYPGSSQVYVDTERSATHIDFTVYKESDGSAVDTGSIAVLIYEFS